MVNVESIWTQKPLKSLFKRNLKSKNSINKHKWTDGITFYLSYFNTQGFMSFFSLDEVCLSSFSRTVSIGFNDFKWHKYSVVSGLIIYLVRKYSETMVGLEILLGLQGRIQTFRQGGPRSSRPWDKEVGRAVSKTKFFSALRASVWAKNKGDARSPCPSPGSATGLSTGLRCSLKRSLSLRLVSPMY